MKNKTKYRLRNWNHYNRSLQQRGSLTFWVSEDVLKLWLVTEKSGQRGASPQYSDLAIQTLATLRAVFHQPGRQTTGLAQSIFELLKINLLVPDHSTLSRRLSQLEIELPVLPAAGGRHIVVDSTGVKVFGEGEWKVQTHGASKRRTWRKLPLAVDAATHEVIVMAATENSVSDGEALPEMLAAMHEEIEQVSADGAYDRRAVSDAMSEKGIKWAAIPPRKGARIWRHGNSAKERLIRDENLRLIRKKGRAKWKREADYH